MPASPPCPLCGAPGPSLFHEDRFRAYLLCRVCQLVYVPKEFWLSLDEEKATYDLHQNDAGDLGYRTFLSRLTSPLLTRLPGPSCGLDFGCGPGPALATLLEEAGHRVTLYDPFYADNDYAFDTTYDFICATEVVEHLRHPLREWDRLFEHLRPGGILAVMTKLVIDQAAFRQWHYIRDLTHICFYQQNTFAYIAKRFGATLEPVDKDVLFLRLPSAL